MYEVSINSDTTWMGDYAFSLDVPTGHIVMISHLFLHRLPWSLRQPKKQTKEHYLASACMGLKPEWYATQGNVITFESHSNRGRGRLNIGPA